MQPARPPQPPTHQEELRVGKLLRWGFADELWARPQPAPPAEWGAQAFGIPRKAGGILAALLFPHEAPRGVVLMGHPATAAAKGFFHENNRVPFARNLGMAVVTFDHGGFGESDGPSGLYHSEWEDVLGWARRRFPDLPIHAWGIELGGYFLHHALARDPGVSSAVFEHVPPDMRFGGALARLGMRFTTPTASAWWPAVAHAPFVHAERVLYAYGEKERELDRLWKSAGPLAQRVVVDGAGPLEAWRVGGESLREAIRKAFGA